MGSESSAAFPASPSSLPFSQTGFQSLVDRSSGSVLPCHVCRSLPVPAGAVTFVPNCYPARAPAVPVLWNVFPLSTVGRFPLITGVLSRRAWGLFLCALGEGLCRNPNWQHIPGWIFPWLPGNYLGRRDLRSCSSVQCCNAGGV